MSHLDGRLLRGVYEQDVDVVVVGSGPAGASAAREAARHGASVIVVEGGRRVDPSEYRPGAWSSMSDLYRSAGTSVVVGSAPIPYLQGKMVGGSSPINGAICWRPPRDVYDEWVAADPVLADALPWQELSDVTDEIEERLGVAPTAASVAGEKNRLMAVGAEALRLEHRPIRRNVRGCEGAGLCMQGCPTGRKQSVEHTLLADAVTDGALVISAAPVDRVVLRAGRAVGVEATAEGGARVRLGARVAVVLAASAVQTPALLVRSGLGGGAVGRNFQCHPGVSLAGRFPHEVRMWEGATQGHEVIGLRREGLKFEALGFGLAILAARLEGVGDELARGIEDIAHWADWGAAVRAEACGRVRVVRGKPVVFFSPSADDVRKYRRGLRVLGDLMFAAGADEVAPGVRGFDRHVRAPGRLAELETSGPRAAAAYTAAVTHMFGTCRMGSQRSVSVVRPDFRHWGVDRLYVADSSVFPSNTGVNPQIQIMSMATMCARRAIGLASAGNGRVHDATSGDSMSTMTASALPGGSAEARRSARLDLTLEDLIGMDAAALHHVLCDGHPLDLDSMADTQYLGVDLSLPLLASRLLWKTFRKTFHRDPVSGSLRGWNVRMEQHGVEGPAVPMMDAGVPLTFGHYVVRSARGVHFPRWSGAHFLDYGAAGNKRRDPARLGYTPLVAVNAGSSDLLLGWEVFRVAGRMLTMPLYWALQRQGPLEHVVDPPRVPRT